MGALARSVSDLTLYRCGALYRLFLHRSFHNLLRNKRESSPHFLFILTHRTGDATVTKNFHMTEEEFKEIVNEISNDCALDLAKQAKWELLHKDDSDTVVVSVSITKVVCLGDNKKENHIVERLTAQQTPESIKCAIVTLNEKILSQLQIDNI